MKKNVYVFLLLFIPVLLNIHLKNYFYQQIEIAKQDLIYRMFGGLRGLLADWAFIKGEVYYHGGLPMKAENFSECLQKEVAQSREEHKGEEQEEHEHEELAHRNEKIKPDLYSRIYSYLKITEHTHLNPAQEKEVLPWFYLQVRFNPHDINGYVLGGYWLRRLGKYEEALRFLKEGEAKNPQSAQVLVEIGDLYFEKKDYEQAIQYLEKARKLWLDEKPPNLVTDDYIRSDRSYTFNLLGHIYEKRGELSRARQVYTELCSLEPKFSFLLEKFKKQHHAGTLFQIIPNSARDKTPAVKTKTKE